MPQPNVIGAQSPTGTLRGLCIRLAKYHTQCIVLIIIFIMALVELLLQDDARVSDAIRRVFKSVLSDPNVTQIQELCQNVTPKGQ